MCIIRSGAAALQRCCSVQSAAVQKVNATTFYTIPMPKAFINMNHDITLLDYRTWLLFSDRVSRSNNAGVPYNVYTIYGDHESMLTQQANLATAILEAVAGLQG